MKKLPWVILVLALLAAGGWLAYKRLQPAQRRLCPAVIQLCGEKVQPDCETLLATPLQALDEKALAKTTSCVENGSQCHEALACLLPVVKDLPASPQAKGLTPLQLELVRARDEAAIREQARQEQARRAGQAGQIEKLQQRVQRTRELILQSRCDEAELEAIDIALVPGSAADPTMEAKLTLHFASQREALLQVLRRRRATGGCLGPAAPGAGPVPAEAPSPDSGQPGTRAPGGTGLSGPGSPDAGVQATAVTGAAPGVAELPEAVGVPECDRYIQDYSRCVSTFVSPSSRTLMARSLESMARAWRTAARTAAGRRGLVRACQAARTSARRAMAAHGCKL